MSRQPSRIGLYLVLIVMLIAGYLYLNEQVASQSNYTMEELEQAAEDGEILSARIYQNREVPTGSIAAEVANVGQKRVYVTDVKEAEKMLKSYGVHPQVENVPQENVFLTALLPVILTGGLVLFLFFMMNRQMSGAAAMPK